MRSSQTHFGLPFSLFGGPCLFSLVTNITHWCSLSTESSDDGSDDEMAAERDSDVSKVQCLSSHS